MAAGRVATREIRNMATLGGNLCRETRCLYFNQKHTFQFAGVNVFPSAMENVIRKMDCFSNEYQIVVPAMGSGKRLKIRVELASSRVSPTDMREALDQFMEEFKYSITFCCQDLELLTCFNPH
jgi:hypothetical protein